MKIKVGDSCWELGTVVGDWKRISNAYYKTNAKGWSWYDTEYKQTILRIAVLNSKLIKEILYV
jgi:hypothetical protein